MAVNLAYKFELAPKPFSRRSLPGSLIARSFASPASSHTDHPSTPTKPNPQAAQEPPLQAAHAPTQHYKLTARHRFIVGNSVFILEEEFASFEKLKDLNL